MARLLLTDGPQAGQHFVLDDRPCTIGRQPGLQIVLDAPEVSRQHARVTQTQGRSFIEDLGSSNGTYLNRLRVPGRSELRDQDELQIGPFHLVFHGGAAGEPKLLIRAELPTLTAHRLLVQEGAGRKLLAVLEVTRQLARTLEMDELLPRLLDHLLGLFPQAERGLILTREGEQLVVRALRGRAPREGQPAYSRSVVRRAFEEGVGILADNPQDDPRFATAHTLMALGVRSFLCVPLQAHGGRALGVVQLDRFGAGTPFTPEDLHLLAAVSIPVSVVLENAGLHARAVENERVQRDLELARLAQLVAGVAHEVNNPLAFVSNNLTVFGRDLHALGDLLALYQGLDAAAAQEADGAAPARPRAGRRDRRGIDAAPSWPSCWRARSDGLKRIEQLVKDLRDFARLDQAAWDEADVGAGVGSVAERHPRAGRAAGSGPARGPGAAAARVVPRGQDQPGGLPPRGQRHRRQPGGRPGDGADQADRGRRRGGGARHRPRHRPGDPRQGVRPVLHDPAAGAGSGSRPEHHLRDRAKPRRHDRLRVGAGAGDVFPRPAAAAAAGPRHSSA